MRTAILIVVVATAFPACAPGETAEPVGLSLVSANVGNSLLSCEGYVYKLCHVDVEERVRAALLELSADVVVLQEVMGDAQCDVSEEDPASTCHPEHRAAEPTQSRRLVGDEYSIACSGRDGYECVAVKTSFGAIEGCDEGARCADAQTPAAPAGCDAGFTVSAVTVVPRAGEAFRVVNGHPPSGFAAACRAREIEQAFEELAGDARALVAGDMNLDPWLDNDDAVLEWDEHVGAGARFAYCSGPNEHDPPYPTTRNPLFTATLDHVVSDFVEGRCTTLGEAPGSERLDGGDGTDHRAVACTLAERPRS